MLNAIHMNLNALEYILFFWQSVMDREKVGEYYLGEIAALPEMQVLYNNEFSEESVRKALSAITNRELLNTSVVEERQFWNNNMGITEDRELLDQKINPIKSLSLDAMKQSLNEQADIPYDTIEVVFIPGLKDTVIQKENKLYINFFKVMVDIFGGTGEVTIEGKAPAAYILDQILLMDGVSKK